NLFERSFDNLREAWSNIADIDPIMTELEVNPQFLQMISPNETVVVISFNSIIGETSGMINICIPHVVLEPIVPNLSVRYWMQSNTKEVSPEQQAIIKNNVNQSILPVVTELGTTQISIEDFLLLRKDDVLQLDKLVTDPLYLKVGDVPKFIVQPGKVKKKLAVQVLESLKGGDGDDE
ncbi:MAG: FliM/FliN family flagellar motor switch protein, partial [Kurthia sp.]